MSQLKIDIENVLKFVSKDEIHAFQEEINEHFACLQNKTGKGNEFLGWMDLPMGLTQELIERHKIECKKN